MPRVDRGSYVVEVSRVLSLGQRERRLLVEWALSEEALLVTEPAIVSVETMAGSLLIAVGVGSLISRSEPPVGGALVLARPEWVDGCSVGAAEPFVERAGRGEGVSGITVLLDPADPVARLINGSQGVAASDAPPAGPLSVASISGVAAVDLLDSGGYRLWLTGGEALERAEYIAPLASSCRGGGGR